MTLTEVSYYTRKLMPLGIVMFLLFLIFFYAAKVYLLYLETQKPKRVYTASFGKIPRPEIKDLNSTAGKLSYMLDTVEGQPTTSTDSARIFFLPASTAKFGFREKIYVMAKTLGFDTDVVKHKLIDTNAVFDDGKESLSIDITNFNFTYEFDTKQDPTLFNNISIPEKNVVEEKAKEFLRTVGRYPEELAKGKTNTTYLLYDPISNQLAPATKPQEANVVEVDFYRPDIGATPQDIPSVSPKYFTSQNYVIMVFNDMGFKAIKVQVKFFEKSEAQIDTYPIKTGGEAYKDLTEGRANIVSITPGDPNIAIKKMFLGYYDPEAYEEYLQPVYVFLGDKDFVGYVPAVANEYASK